MKQQKHKEILEAAGVMADRCRRIVGGKDLNGFGCPAANVYTIGELLNELRKAVDYYDKLILRSGKCD